MKLGLFVNTNLPKASELCERVLAEAKKCKAEVTVVRHDLQTVSAQELRPLVQGADFVVTVGGDGTVLAVVAQAAGQNIPILAVNAGHLGFLTEEVSAPERWMERLLRGEYSVERRPLLRVEHGDSVYYALNDAVLSRSTRSQTTCISAYLQHALVDRYRGDGVVVCTPTGSTAYALAAGGPVLCPTIAANALVPLCAHSLHSRPIVFDCKETLRLVAEGRDVLWICDGRTVAECAVGDEVTIRTAELSAAFVRMGDTNFYERLFGKLKQWGTTEDTKC
mgnify:CR=1 FL=1